MNWRKSSRSGAYDDNCVELARTRDVVAARDSKNPDGPCHEFDFAAMTRLFEEIRRGRYDLT